MDIHQETDGTWSVLLRPWSDKKIMGFATAEAALDAEEKIYEAMKAFSKNDHYED